MRGNLAWESLIELFLIAMIATLIILTSASTNSKAIQESILVKDFGLSLSLSSFIPGNLQYVYTLEEDKNLFDWSKKGINIRLSGNKISYGEKYLQSYPFYLKIPFISYSTPISQESINISKTTKFSTEYNPTYNCASNEKFKIYRVKGPVGTYNVQGVKLEQDSLDIVGFETQYFKSGERLFLSPLSVKIGDKMEFEILKDIVKKSSLNQIYEEGFKPQINLNKNTVLINTKYSKENMVKVFFPKSFFNSSCEVYNSFLSNFKTSLIPYDENHILISFSGDDSFFSNSNLNLFSKSLEVLNG